MISHPNFFVAFPELRILTRLKPPERGLDQQWLWAGIRSPIQTPGRTKADEQLLWKFHRIGCRISRGSACDMVTRHHIRYERGLSEAIRYALVRWPGLMRFMDEGARRGRFRRGQRAIRPLALNRKNTLFAASDGGGEHWAILASIIETSKLNGVAPRAYLPDVLAAFAAGHPITRIDELLPWSWAAAHQVLRAA